MLPLLLSFIILSLILFVLSRLLIALYGFVEAKLDDAMNDILWGQSVIYDIDYAIVRFFKGDDIDRGKQALAKYEDLCKEAMKKSKWLLTIARLLRILSIILLLAVAVFLILLFVRK